MAVRLGIPDSPAAPTQHSPKQGVIRWPQRRRAAEWAVCRDGGARWQRSQAIKRSWSRWGEPPKSVLRRLRMEWIQPNAGPSLGGHRPLRRAGCPPSGRRSRRSSRSTPRSRPRWPGPVRFHPDRGRADDPGPRGPGGEGMPLGTPNPPTIGFERSKPRAGLVADPFPAPRGPSTRSSPPRVSGASCSGIADRIGGRALARR